ncbi:hypothetical protein PFICI_00767 [Pestalotiopsis fici W106-1]|uniref:Ecp2 effector protein domain-containing protein n=1 Tax=Pestalotiopsis fici (strain W106-1 / CGMCC3.15140) TaxID=1229662 RepID=W3XLR3_PESFW|nr:uncharacterized protein PFICI_00767 [Pestalotiopsis fici W106-1]ETS86939.1 hypothetical protein PFICI_00767 [Pestalotiopsis fici W106-1]
MQFSNALLAIISAAATAQAGCFTRGDGNGQGDGHYGQGLNQYDILSSVAPLLKGHYLSNEERQQCAMDTYQNKWKFYVKASFRDSPHSESVRKTILSLLTFLAACSQNTDGKPNDISEDTVKQYLHNEAYACQYGGKSTQEGHWEIVSDPNPGECVSSSPSSKRDTTVRGWRA